MWSLATAATTSPAKLDGVLLLGFLAAFAWLVCWKEQRVSIVFSAGLVVSSAALSIFGFMQPGAWPLGIVQGAWTIIAFRRCFKPMAKRIAWQGSPQKNRLNSPDHADLPSRSPRQFGSIGSDN